MATDGLEEELEDLTCQLEQHAGCKVPEGYNSSLRFMCHLWDPLRHVYRSVDRLVFAAAVGCGCGYAGYLRAAAAA
jgi:hypothetical protein